MTAFDRSNAIKDWIPHGAIPTRPGLLRVNADDLDHILLLYRLLCERTPDQSISHKRVPTFSEHAEFVRGRPYLAWYLLIGSGNDGIVGSIYLTRQREIGVFVFGAHQGKGYGGMAVQEVMRIHADADRPFLANINPANEASIRFFESLGFKHIQNTYALTSQTQREAT
jgi:RimJ/RimL family protein N-acetyltransferase